MAKKQGAFQILQDATAPAAFHNSGDRRDPPKCHPNTRLGVLTKIKQWIMGEDSTISNHSIMWVHGPAGSGKSAIEQTIAEMLFADDQLLASFFFSRFDPARNHSRTIIPTLAYQIATCFTGARQAVQSALESDPLLLTRSLSAQLTSLVAKPLQTLVQSGRFDSPHSRRVIVIDGLDECEDRDGQIEILHAISQSLEKHRLPLLFLISSRPEPQIVHAFTSESLTNMTVRLALDSSYSPSRDIKIFLSDKFYDITQRHPLKSTIPSEWPSDDVLQRLVDKSSGQFIYAATVVRFVQSIRHKPADRLEIVLGLRPTSREMPFGELDALYHQIFEAVEDKETTLDILSCELLLQGCGMPLALSVDDIETILSLQPGDAQLFLSDLRSIVDIGPHSTRSLDTLHFFHASLQDFLFDARRSRGLHIDVPSQHCKLALKVLANEWIFDNHSKAFLDLLGWHVLNAKPSPALLQAIRGLDIIRVYSSDSKHEYRLVQSIGPFLRQIKNSKLMDTEDIYTIHFQNFYAYASRQLEIYYNSPMLTALISIVLLPYASGSNVQYPLFETGELIAEPSGPNSGLRISYFGTVKADGDYADLIRQICSDPHKPDLYFDSSRYATAALFFASHISQPSPKELSAFPASKRLKHSPWKWRKTVIWQYKRLQWDAYHWYSFQVKYSSTSTLKYQRNEGNRRNWMQSAARQLYSRYSLGDLLKCFSVCVQQAGPSQELSAFIARMTLNLLAHTYKTQLKEVRVEIRRYLARQEPRSV